MLYRLSYSLVSKTAGIRTRNSRLMGEVTSVYTMLTI